MSVYKYRKKIYHFLISLELIEEILINLTAATTITTFIICAAITATKEITKFKAAMTDFITAWTITAITITIEI